MLSGLRVENKSRLNASQHNRKTGPFFPLQETNGTTQTDAMKVSCWMGKQRKDKYFLNCLLNSNILSGAVLLAVGQSMTDLLCSVRILMEIVNGILK